MVSSGRIALFARDRKLRRDWMTRRWQCKYRGEAHVGLQRVQISRGMSTEAFTPEAVARITRIRPCVKSTPDVDMKFNPIRRVY